MSDNNPIFIDFKIGTSGDRRVTVYPDDPFYVLMKKLNITDKNTKFIYNGVQYTIGSIQTFREINLTSNAKIYMNNAAIAGL